MTGQIPDEVRYRRRRYAITAVDGTGLFDPTNYGITPGPLSTACWRGFTCAYLIQRGRLVLDAVDLGRVEDQTPPARLFGVAAHSADADGLHPGALRYHDLVAPVVFTGRLLLGADPVHIGYLNMGFRPAWCYERVLEVAFDGGVSLELRPVRRAGRGTSAPRHRRVDGDARRSDR